MNKTELPLYELKVLEDEGINKNDILYVCPTDISSDGAYENGYLVLTRDRLVGITKKSESEYEIRTFVLAKYAHWTIENMVATNLLRAAKNAKDSGDDASQSKERDNLKDGEHVLIGACTNTHLEKLMELRKLIRSGAGIASQEIDPAQDKAKSNGADADSTDDDPTQEKAEGEDAGQEPDKTDKQPDGKNKSKTSVFFRGLSYFLRYKGHIALLAVCYILTAVLSIAWPYLSGSVLYDRILARDDSFLAAFGVAGKYIIAVILLVVVMLGIKVIQMLTAVLQGIVMGSVVTKSVRDMKKDVFSAIEDLSMNFYTSKQTGNLMTRVLRDADRMTEFYLDGLPYLIINSITIIVTFAVMFALNWQMSVVACILLPLLVVLSVKLRPGIWTLFGRRHRAESAVNSKVNDNLTGARVVRSFGQEDAEEERFVGPNKNLEEAEVRIVRYSNRFTLLYEMVQVISSIWVWALGVVMVLNFRSISLGVLITFVGYVDQLNGPMRFFSWIFRMWSDSINAAQRIFEIIDAIPDVVECENPIRLSDPKGKIDINNMTFGYNRTHPVLKNINLHVKPGEMLGIVGKSGAGKTTLVNLLSRLYDADEGEIFIDDVDIKKLAFADLRKNIAVVSQDTYIFMGTVAQNIAYADENASREDIIKAAKLASAHDFISRMPDGYDTVIGASGQALSGGERQRLSIARAIIANPRILILDEATASVDTATEKAIQQALELLVKGRTTLSIAHRLSTLDAADRIIVIENGRIAEEGTIDELAGKEGGIYRHLLELQNTQGKGSVIGDA